MTTSQALYLFKHHLGHLCSCGSMEDHGTDITLCELIEAWQYTGREEVDYEFKLDSYCSNCKISITSSLWTHEDIEQEVVELFKGKRQEALCLLVADLELDITENLLVMETLESLAKLQGKNLVYLVCHNAFFDINDKGDTESTEGLISLHKTLKDAMEASKEWDDGWDQEQLVEAEGHSYIRMEVL